VKKLSENQVRAFQKIVMDFYRVHGRHDLPWRPQGKAPLNPYYVVVSELMLQQTQVVRVIPKFTLFIELFPNWEALARAPLSEILTVWQGLGYARRAKFLQAIAFNVVNIYKGELPKRIAELEQLPGIGAYTARAIATFAYNHSCALIETNIRTVYTHHFFSHTHTIHDTDIHACVEQTLFVNKPREWMYALMDYGSHLKSQGISYNARSKHYVKQKPLAGSVREVRGYILKLLTEKKYCTATDIQKIESIFDTKRVCAALEGLVKDSLIVLKKNWYEVRK
jgi:A/G-specific adenine glycosylase